MLQPVDYDQRQHLNYRQGRDLGPENRALWSRALVARAPQRRPLRALDLGSGVGRYSAMLADTFSGEAYAVEPSARMRAEAMRAPAHPRVRILPGMAEAIPLPDWSCDVVLMFLSFHHVRDKPKAAREIARVLQDGGRVFIRSPFSDRAPDLHWHQFFPSAREVERAMFPTLEETARVFAEVGLRPLALDTVEEQMASSLAEYTERLRLRSVSTFEHLSEAEIEEGFASLDAAVAAEREPQPLFNQSDLLTLG